MRLLRRDKYVSFVRPESAAMLVMWLEYSDKRVRLVRFAKGVMFEI